MEIKAELNHLHIAPRKVRLVADMVRSMDVRRAESALAHMPKRSAAPLLKLLRSAIANARHNFQITGDDFYIKTIRVDPGPAAKRTRARAFGRAAAIRKRTSHVFLLLDSRGSGAGSGGFGEKSAPVVRDKSDEDIQNFAEARSRRNRTLSRGSALNPKAPGIVRKMFQRKAI